MQTLDIYRNGALLVSIKPDNNSNQIKQVMGDNALNVSFEDSRNLAFQINDYCDVFGERYLLNKLPGLTKGSRFDYKYSLVLQSEAYDLAKASYLFLGLDNELREADFSLMGTADDFLNLVLANANRAGSGWTKGQVIPSSYKNLTFSKSNCYNALSRLAEEFETEFWIIGKVIHLTKRSNDTGHTYKNARNKGLYQIVRQNLDNSSIVTRLYPFGSDKNLPTNYNGKKLRLPGFYPFTISNLTNTVYNVVGADLSLEFHFDPITATGATGVRIEFRPFGSTDTWAYADAANGGVLPITIPNGDYEFRFRTLGGVGANEVTTAVHVTGVFLDPLFPGDYSPYLEKNVAKYGVIEFSENFDDIYPSRTGTVTAVDALDPFVFIDAAIDFNVNDQLLPGLAAKVVFNTGQLAGYEFEVSSFNDGTNQFRILKNKDEVALDVPSNLLRPAIGDTYVLVNINMPQSYIEAAELRLKAAAQTLLDQISEPQLRYSMTFDPAYLKKMMRTISIGDLVWIIDEELELQRKIRVTSTIRNIVDEYSYQVELSDTVTPGTISIILNAQASTGLQVADIVSQLLNNSILNNQAIGILKILQGTLLIEDIPETADLTGFSEVLIEDATGKLFKKV